MKNSNYKKKDSNYSNNKKLSNYTKDGSNTSISSIINESVETNKQFTDRFDYLLTQSIGNKAIITVASGIQYEGLLVACNLESTNGIDAILKFPKVLKSIDSSSIDDLSETFLIHVEDIVELELKNIVLSFE